MILREPTPWKPDPESWLTWLFSALAIHHRYWAPGKIAATSTEEGWVVYTYDPRTTLSFSDRVADGSETGADGRLRADAAIREYRAKGKVGQEHGGSG